MPCTRCGADEWQRRQDRKGWRCAPCQRKHQREYKSRRDKSISAPRLYESARYRARKQGTEFTITQDDVLAVIPRDGRCPVLGVKLVPGKGKMHDGSPTLDRINPQWGYTPDNIAVISCAANRAKGALTARELERIAAWMRSRGMN